MKFELNNRKFNRTRVYDTDADRWDWEDRGCWMLISAATAFDSLEYILEHGVISVHQLIDFWWSKWGVPPLPSCVGVKEGPLYALTFTNCVDYDNVTQSVEITDHGFEVLMGFRVFAPDATYRILEE